MHCVTTVGSGFDEGSIAADIEKEMGRRQVILNEQQQKDLADIAKRALRSDDPHQTFLSHIHRYASLRDLHTEIERAVGAVAGRLFSHGKDSSHSAEAAHRVARLMQELETKLIKKGPLFYVDAAFGLKKATMEDFIRIAKGMPEFRLLQDCQDKEFLKELYRLLIWSNSAVDPKVRQLAAAIKTFCGIGDGSFELVAISLAEALVGKKPPFLFDASSVADVLGHGADEVMVYGFSHAHYREVYRAFCHIDSPVINVFDWKARGRQGPKMERISDQKKPARFDAGQNRINKGILVDLAFENYKRKQEGLPLIPLLFCLQSNTAEGPAATPESVCSSADFFTIKELRRLYRLEKLFAQSPHPELREISDIVRETTHMVRVDKGPDGVFRFANTPAPWADPAWDQAWKAREERKKAKGEALSEEAKQDLWWRKDLRERIAAYNTRLRDANPGAQDQLSS